MKKQVYRFTYFPIIWALKRFAKEKKLKQVILSIDFVFFLVLKCGSLSLNEIVYEFYYCVSKICNIVTTLTTAIKK